jgi:demethylmenaquinone methyltransferase/2-methoxy-6-polyprenyl-1,4-benzoquinol methylase
MVKKQLRSDYTKYFAPDEQNALRNHNLDEAVVTFSKDFNTIIDIGAGVGTLALKLKSLGKDPICVDLKPNYVEAMKRKGLNAQVGDVRKLNFKDKEFELAICEEVLEHLENPGIGLSELCRIAKNVIFTLPKMHPDLWHLWFIDWKEQAGCIVVKLMERENGNK